MQSLAATIPLNMTPVNRAIASKAAELGRSALEYGSETGDFLIGAAEIKDYFMLVGAGNIWVDDLIYSKNINPMFRSRIIDKVCDDAANFAATRQFSDAAVDRLWSYVMAA